MSDTSVLQEQDKESSTASPRPAAAVPPPPPTGQSPRPVSSGRYPAAMAVTEPVGTSVWEIFAIFRRFWLRSSICFIAVFGLGVAGLITLPKKFKSEAELLVRLGRENIGLDPTATLGNSQTVNVTQNRSEEISSVAAMLANRVLAEKVVDRVGPDTVLADALNVGQMRGGSSILSHVTGFVPRIKELAYDMELWPEMSPRDKAIRKFQKQLAVSPIPKTNLVGISYESRDPELSKLVVGAATEIYLDEHVRLHRSPGAYDFLIDEKVKVENELNQAEESLRSLKNETGLVSPVEQRVALVEQISGLRGQQLNAQADVAEAKAEIDTLTSKMDRLTSTTVSEEREGIANHAVEEMRNQLFTLQIREQELLASHTQEHSRVKAIRNQIEATQKILEKEEKHRTETTIAPNRIYEETKLLLIQKEAYLEAMVAKETALNELIQQSTKELELLNNNELKVNQLRREVEIREISYRKYATDTELARIDQSLEAARMSNISLAQPATLEFYPSSPNLMRSLLLIFIAAGIASSGVAILSESRLRWKKARTAVAC